MNDKDLLEDILLTVKGASDLHMTNKCRFYL